MPLGSRVEAIEYVSSIIWAVSSFAPAGCAELLESGSVSRNPLAGIDDPYPESAKQVDVPTERLSGAAAVGRTTPKSPGFPRGMLEPPSRAQLPFCSCMMPTSGLDAHRTSISSFGPPNSTFSSRPCEAASRCLATCSIREFHASSPRNSAKHPSAGHIKCSGSLHLALMARSW